MRKFDFYAQLILIILVVFASLLCFLQPGYIIFCLLGMMILGPWQIISAITITINPVYQPFKKHIRHYWIASIIMIAIICGTILINNNAFEIPQALIFLIAGSMAIAVYYVYLYGRYFLTIPAEKPQPEDLLQPL